MPSYREKVTLFDKKNGLYGAAGGRAAWGDAGRGAAGSHTFIAIRGREDDSSHLDTGRTGTTASVCHVTAVKTLKISRELPYKESSLLSRCSWSVFP
jgi:hypothetical protein